MYGSCPTEVDQPSNAIEFVAKLQDRLQKAYTRIRDTMGHQLDRPKELYNEQIHGKPFKNDDLVWLHSKVIPSGVGQKLHHPGLGLSELSRDCLSQQTTFRTLLHQRFD